MEDVQMLSPEAEKLRDFLSHKSLSYPFDFLVLCHAASLAHGDEAQLRARLAGILKEIKSQGHIRGHTALEEGPIGSTDRRE